MFSSNERAVIDILAPGGALDAGTIGARAELAKSSTHVALKSLAARGLVIEQTENGKTLFRLAPKSEIELIGRRVLDDFHTAFAKTQWNSAERPRLVFTDQYQLPDEMLQQLRQRYDVVTFGHSPEFMDDELFGIRSADADVVVRFDRPTVDDSYLDACPKLRAIVCPALFNSNIDMEACERRGVKVVSFDHETQRYTSRTQLEYVVQASLSLLRPLARIADDVARTGEYYFGNFLGPDIGGSRIGLVISGTNVRRHVDVFRALDCEVRVASLLDAPPTPAIHGLSGYTGLQELWETSDIAVFMDDAPVDLDPFFSAGSIPKYLVITSDGAQYSHAVLRDALVSGRLKGIAIDNLPHMFTQRVFDQHLQKSLKPIINLPNVMITPEMCAMSTGSLALSHRYTFEALMKLDLA